MKDIQQLQPLLAADPAPNIAIIMHHKPDADALGSSLGLAGYLQKKGLKPQVISPSDYGAFLQWMPGNDTVVIYDHQKDKAKQLLLEADMVFCLDFNTTKRVYELTEALQQTKAIKVMIDHHLAPEGFDDYRLWTTETSSTCELIYDYIKLMGDEDLIDADIASCIYAGIMTDTGSFRFDSTSPETHRVVARLIDKGAESARIHELVYDNFTEQRTRFIGYCLYEKMEILSEYNTALIALSAEELEQFQLVTGDTEGLVNYGLSINGIRFAALIVDRTVRIKMSFRSKGNFPANEFASQHFNGGGHFKAAGGESEETLEATVARFKAALPAYKSLLNQ